MGSGLGASGGSLRIGVAAVACGRARARRGDAAARARRGRRAARRLARLRAARGRARRARRGLHRGAPERRGAEGPAHLRRAGGSRFALAGGVLMGLAAKMTRGCTSGQALSGGALLSVGSWAFMFSVFARRLRARLLREEGVAMTFPLCRSSDERELGLVVARRRSASASGSCSSAPASAARSKLVGAVLRLRHDRLQGDVHRHRHRDARRRGRLRRWGSPSSRRVADHATSSTFLVPMMVGGFVLGHGLHHLRLLPRDLVRGHGLGQDRRPPHRRRRRHRPGDLGGAGVAARRSRRSTT